MEVILKWSRAEMRCSFSTPIPIVIGVQFVSKWSNISRGHSNHFEHCRLTNETSRIENYYMLKDIVRQFNLSRLYRAHSWPSIVKCKGSCKIHVGSFYLLDWHLSY